MANRDIPAPIPRSPEEIFEALKQKYHPVFLEMSRRGVKLKEVTLENNSRLSIRGEARTKDDVNYVFDEIRMIDPELEEVSADIEVARGQG